MDESLMERAVAVARAAGDNTLRWFRSAELVVDGKADGTPVTQADRDAERLARQLLADSHPGDAIVGEEESPTPGSTGRTWFIDPIDGTQAFTHGVPSYSTLVAVTDDHGPAVGVIHLPALGETVWAGRGRGCRANGQPVSVTSRTAVDGAWVVTSGLEGWPEGALGRLQRAGVRLRTWGDGFGYALVATGRADAMVDPVAAVWDLAPMPVILAEAGGRFTDWTGTGRADGGTGLGSNGRLHDNLLTLLT